MRAHLEPGPFVAERGPSDPQVGLVSLDYGQTSWVSENELGLAESVARWQRKRRQLRRRLHKLLLLDHRQQGRKRRQRHAVLSGLDCDAADGLVFGTVIVVLGRGASVERVDLVLAGVAGLGVDGPLPGVLPEPGAQERLDATHGRAGPRAQRRLAVVITLVELQLGVGLAQLALLGLLETSRGRGAHDGEAAGDGRRRRGLELERRTVVLLDLLDLLLLLGAIGVEDGLGGGELDLGLVAARVVGEVEVEVSALLLHVAALYRRGLQSVAAVLTLLTDLSGGRGGRVGRAYVDVARVAPVAVVGVNSLAEVVSQRHVRLCMLLLLIAEGRTIVEAGSGYTSDPAVLLGDGRSGAGVGRQGVRLVVLAAEVLVSRDSETGDVAVEEAEVNEQDGGDGREDTDDGDDDERSGAGQRQAQRQRDVVHVGGGVVLGPEPRLEANERQLGYDEAEYGQGDDDRRDQADYERGVVSSADAVVEPLAVMVEAGDALVADRAVLRSLGGGVDITQMTPAVLDDV